MQQNTETVDENRQSVEVVNAEAAGEDMIDENAAGENGDVEDGVRLEAVDKKEVNKNIFIFGGVVVILIVVGILYGYGKMKELNSRTSLELEEMEMMTEDGANVEETETGKDLDYREIIANATESAACTEQVIEEMKKNVVTDQSGMLGEGMHEVKIAEDRKSITVKFNNSENSIVKSYGYNGATFKTMFISFLGGAMESKGVILTDDGRIVEFHLDYKSGEVILEELDLPEKIAEIIKSPNGMGGGGTVFLTESGKIIKNEFFDDSHKYMDWKDFYVMIYGNIDFGLMIYCDGRLRGGDEETYLVDEFGQEVKAKWIFNTERRIGGLDYGNREFFIVSQENKLLKLSYIGGTLKSMAKEENQENYGPGVILGTDEQGTMIEIVLPNSPADKIGLEVGDLILRIKDKTGWNDVNVNEQAVDIISSTTKTPVGLMILREGYNNNQPFEVEVGREIKAVDWIENKLVAYYYNDKLVREIKTHGIRTEVIYEDGSKETFDESSDGYYDVVRQEYIYSER